MSHFASLPKEVLFQIFDFLKWRDIRSLLRTHKALCKYLKENAMHRKRAIEILEGDYDLSIQHKVNESGGVFDFGFFSTHQYGNRDDYEHHT